MWPNRTARHHYRKEALRPVLAFSAVIVTVMKWLLLACKLLSMFPMICHHLSQHRHIATPVVHNVKAALQLGLEHDLQVSTAPLCRLSCCTVTQLSLGWCSRLSTTNHDLQAYDKLTAGEYKSLTQHLPPAI